MSKEAQKPSRRLCLKLPSAQCAVLLALTISLALTGCTALERPAPSPYFAEVVTPPAKKEFRWSNGRLPKSFDPALAAAPPETDVVRAIYEGLTATDVRTLDPIPAAAEKWTSSDGHKVWNFQIRKDAVWSNGKRVTSVDFVRAWNRLASLGEKAAHPELLRNFARIRAGDLPKSEAAPKPTPWNSDEPPPLIPKRSPAPEGEAPVGDHLPLDVRAVSDSEIEIRLLSPDPDLPRMLANPIFCPIFGNGSEFSLPEPENSIVGNGAYRLAMVTADQVVLDKSDTYRAAAQVSIDTVRFIPVENAEEALEAYRTGRVDAVTNAEFEPLALKVLAPFQDFRRVTHGALNLYEFNSTKAPFSDRHVREALAIAIERERLTEGEMEGSTRPALRLLPLGGDQTKELIQDIVRAKQLMADAGFPDGKGFPVIRLVINRNDAQQRIARAVARMWKQNLGIETDIVNAELSDMDEVRRSGDFDLIRRGIVFPSADVRANLSVIFEPREPAEPVGRNGEEPRPDIQSAQTRDPAAASVPRSVVYRSEEDALFDLAVIPLYFPSSYSLVKPYVQGFEPNSLDIYSIQDVRIDNNWQPKRPQSES